MKVYITTLILSGILAVGNAQTNTFPATGDVGIGTLSPTATLDIYKAGDPFIKVRTDGGNYAYLHLTDGSSSGYLIKNSGGYTGNGVTPGALYTYVNTGYDFQHVEQGVPRFTIKSGGNVGIGTIAPDTKLHVSGSGNMLKIENTSISANAYSQMNLKAGTADNYIWTNNQNSAGFYGGPSALNIYTGQSSPIAFFTAASERMRVDGDGNVGIGTNAPSEKLSVNGNIRAKQVKVESTGWSDFVFGPEYKLPGLKETEQFIKANRHLPEIPSAKEVAEKGINLGEMDARLLQKIEELTLYIIELNKKLIALEKKVEAN